VFLDEWFKSNSASHSLLTLLNERSAMGGQVLRCPLISVFAASNEVPGDETLNAIFDRFLIRVRSDNPTPYHFSELLTRGIDHEIRQMNQAQLRPFGERRRSSRAISQQFQQRMRFDDRIPIPDIQGICFRFAPRGGLSDRRVVKLLKLFAARVFSRGAEHSDAKRPVCAQTHLEQPGSSARARGDRPSRCSRRSIASTRTSARWRGRRWSRSARG